MPDPQRLLNTLHRAAEAFRNTPGRKGRFVELGDMDDVMVAGDLHGHLDNFKRILEPADLANHPRRHLVLQELVHGPFRYPDTGGDQSHRLLDLLAALKCQYPHRVHMLLGNHELSEWTNRAIMKEEENLNQLFRLGVATAYGEHANEIYAAYQALFAIVPLALRTPNRIFLSHSLPGAKRLASWEFGLICKDRHETDDLKLGGCVHALVWGRDLSAATAERFLQKVDADLLITGHVPCEEGLQVPNPHQLILDCKDDNACYCLFPTDRPLTHEQLVACVKRLR